ncbi:MAG: glycosyltransferase [Candidatus Poseidoniia archaeon]|nr:glycosyltransferase [Candidatus Poseidoniia archaeon]MDP6658839.1 glycosyltransferase [Candidatus Poseidoniia archaeon]MDP6846734.1 glycosyltransferase [Candidatus Poseidoniia archaeon]MDP7006921.1 glycosyltransferase [Candidatus Poseidoniia archaeon]
MAHVVMLRTRLTSGAQPEPVVADTAASLAALDHEVTLLAWDRDGDSDCEAQAGWGRLVRYRRACSLNAPLAFVRELPRFWCWCLRRIIALRGGDLVIHAHDLDTLPLGLFAARLLRAPLVYDCHENYPALVEGAVSHRAALRLHQLEARLLRRCDGVLAAGPQGFARLTAMRHEGGGAPFSAPLEEALAVLKLPQPELVRDGVALVGNLKRLEDYPAATIAARKPGKQLKVLYIGVLEKRPSRGILETALAIEGLRDVEFQIGGFGTLVPQLERLCRRLRHSRYLGPVPPGDVARLTLEADAVLMALDPANLNSRLSAPNKLFEAMCAGVPVITCSELLMGHFVADEQIGATFAWGDWRALRRSARELRDSPATRDAMGRRGRALAESGFHWDAAAERLARLYDSVLKR